MCMHIYIQKTEERVKSLELKLHVIASCLMWVFVGETRFSLREASIPNHWAISHSQPMQNFYFMSYII